MSNIQELFNEHIKNTAKGEMIFLKKIQLCETGNDMPFRNYPVYISTKSLKHIYDRHYFDKQVPEDFALIIENLATIVSNPQNIFINEPDKRGNFLFTRKINEKTYLAMIEAKEDPNIIEIVSASFSGEKYLKKFTLLWSEGTANPLS